LLASDRETNDEAIAVAMDSFGTIARKLTQAIIGEFLEEYSLCGLCKYYIIWIACDYERSPF
jgi:hypothetical protein